jgi:pyruvate, water dikinase
VAGAAAPAQYSRPLAGLRRNDEPQFGGKSANLGELLVAGIPVPPGFALSTAAFRTFLAQSGLVSEIDQRLGSLSTDDLDSAGSACAAIGEAIRSAPVPAAVEQEITRGYAELAREGGDSVAPVAVRSSAIGEDSVTTTFAGQQETFLWVQGSDGVVRCVRDCWASLYSLTAVSYRAKATQGAQAPAMGVTVQLMVDALVSGVMFTCSPVSGDPSIVAINASWGLGEAVVGGEVTPDEYVLSKVTGEVVRKRIGAKHVEHVPAPAGGGTVRREVPAERRDAPCLSESDLRALVDLARRVERHFGSRQDIEWAIARAGSPPDGLFVLQSRPVTAVPTQPKKPEPRSAISFVMGTFGADRAPGDA